MMPTYLTETAQMPQYWIGLCNGEYHAFRVEAHSGDIELYPIPQSWGEAGELCGADLTNWMKAHHE
jgi:hypothetical protein